MQSDHKTQSSLMFNVYEVEAGEISNIHASIYIIYTCMKYKEEENIIHNVQVVETVKYMHEQGVTHNDIKDENIIVER